MTGRAAAVRCFGVPLRRNRKGPNRAVGMTDPLPEDVRRFLDEHIESLEQLEILRVLAEDPGREWSAGELAAEIQAEAATAATHVTSLAARGLVTTSARGGETVARHGARPAELVNRLAKVLAAYRERPVTMIKLVYAKANERLRAFSDAFRLRKEG